MTLVAKSIPVELHKFILGIIKQGSAIQTIRFGISIFDRIHLIDVSCQDQLFKKFKTFSLINDNEHE